MKPGTLCISRHSSPFYMHESLSSQEEHREIRRHELLLYLGGQSTGDFLRITDGSNIGWIYKDYLEAI